MENDDVASMELPPGFRFHPTDEEIIMHYLLKKVLDRGFKATAISDADLNKCEPWDLPKKGKLGEKEWFFFFQRDKKYPTGARTNRATESGYWKATGKDREIHYKSKSCLVGMKKTLVFYRGRAPKGEKTDWVMHEYRLEGKFSNYNLSRSAKEEFVVCRVFHKNTGNRTPSTLAGFELARIDSLVDHLSDSSTLPPLMDYYTSCSNSFATREHDQWQGSNIGSSSRVFLNNHKLQYLQYYMPIQEGFGPGMSSYQHNVFPFKGGYGEENLRVMTPKMEQYFSSKNLGISQSEETGHSMENVGNYESTTWQSKGDDVESRNIVKPFDYQEIEGLGFSPGISDLDSLWSY